MRRFSLFLIHLLAMLVCANVAASRYVKLTQFTTEDGLKINNVVSLLQDNEGYLWVSTPEGITRFDGYRMQSIASPNNSLANLGTDLVWQDSKGLIWFGSFADSNFVLDKNNNSLKEIELEVPLKYDVKFPILTKAIEDKEANVWLASYGELFFYQRDEDQFHFVLSIDDLLGQSGPKHLIRGLLAVDQYLIIATSNGAFAYNRTTRQTKSINHLPKGQQSEETLNVKSLHLSGQKILFGTVNGLFEFDKSQLRLEFEQQSGVKVVDNLNIWEIIEKQDFYWLATNLGLYRYHFNGDLEFIFKLSDTPFSTSDDDLVTMIEDREGVLWFGTKSDGVFKWRPNPAIKKHLWSKGKANFKLNNDNINSVYRDSNETLWIGTSNGLTELNSRTWEAQTHLVNPDEKAVGTASSIYSINEIDDKLWLVTGKGLQVYNKQTMMRENIIFPKTEEELFSNPSIALNFISDKQVLIIGERGIYDYNPQSNQINFIEGSEYPGNYFHGLINFFEQLPKNNNQRFIAGFDKLYLYSIDSGTTEIFHQIKSTKVRNVIVGDIHKDGDTLWVTYPGHGLYQLDFSTGKEIKFLSSKEIKSDSAMDLFSDQSGHLWFTSNDGLFRLNKLNLQVTKFDRYDGFASSEFNSGTATTLDSESQALGSVKGLYIFEPEKVQDKNDFKIKPLLTGIELLSAESSYSLAHYDNQAVEMDYHDFGLRVQFSAMLLDKPDQVKYFYWMAGDSKLEKTPINESELFFPRFEPGNNTLYISAVDYRNGTESMPTSIDIISHPAWWGTLAAKISYILTILLILAIVFYRHQQKLIKREIVHDKIKKSEERLSLALRGSQSGLWDWHAEDNSVYDPRIPNDDVVANEGSVPISQRFLAIHYKDQNKITAKWRDFLRNPQGVFSAAYRMRDEDQEWQWYRDIAMVSERDQLNNPLRVTGTFTNITEIQNATEKTRLYSSAFENTLDIIVILDRHKKITACNDAMKKITGWSLKDIAGKTLDDVLTAENNRKITNHIFEKIDNSRHWKGEALLKDESEQRIPILVSATIFVENDTEQYYVFSMSDISKQKEAELELKKLVNYDPLTSMPNRTLLLDRISHAIPHCARYKKQLAVFFVDLDRFKQVNDTLGHEAGDRLLIKTASILRECCREDDTVARIGGDEFVVMLEDIDSVTVINRILQKILNRMNEPMTLGDNRVTISTSIGVSIYPQDASDAKTLLKHADIAMYHAKSKGRNNFQYFQDYMNRAARHRLTLENKVRTAVSNNEFSLAYQPLFDLESGQIKGVEALARWHTESGEMIPPSSFIPLAEELGLIIPMTESLIRQALDALTRWKQLGYNLSLAFNISASHIYHKDFANFIGSLVPEYPRAISNLELELTESILMEDVDKARRVLEKISEFDIEVALDDFGTGYSSLKYLSRLPISKLKIDMSFIQQIGTSFENDAVIETIISLAKSLRLKTVAEGIETQKQFEFLKKSKVDFAQGYLLSKPTTRDELEKALQKNLFQTGKIKRLIKPVE